jgi:ParB family chromosome partitioning protein
MSKKKALGRGLNALLSDSEDERLEVDIPIGNSPSSTSSPTGGLNEIPVSQIEVNPFQPRSHFDEETLKELSESIKVHGIIQPITVRRLAHNQYQLIAGERRFQASKLAGLEKIPAYIRSADDQQMLEMALIENIQRENLNAIEIALSYQRLISE